MGRKGWIGIAVISGWAIMTALLLQREWGGERIDTTQNAVDTATTSSTWLGIFVTDGPQVGHIHLRRAPEERRGSAGIRFTMSSQMALNLLGRDTDLELLGTFWRSLEQPVAELELKMESLGQTLELTGEVQDGALKSTVVSGGETLPLELPMDPEILLQTGLGTASQFPAMDVGDDFRMESFDPLTMQKATARVRCVDTEVLEIDGVGLETKLLEVTTSGFTSRAWVDDTGEVVRAETPFGLMMQRLSPEHASAMAGTSASGGDLLGLTAIKPKGARPQRGATELRIRVSGLEDGTEIPLGAHQSLTVDGELRITRDRDPELTAGGGGRRDFAPLLAADAFVQSDHPRIVEQAAAIVGDTGDPKEKALRIHHWVYETVEKVPVMSIPSALEVLESLKGDCNEHTVLYTALARAAGLPTRIAIGVVWSDDLDGFYYHAWPEVWVGDGFERLDPTLGQPAADATHVKLLEGGIETWPKLLAFLGRMEFEVTQMEMPGA